MLFSQVILYLSTDFVSKVNSQDSLGELDKHWACWDITCKVEMGKLHPIMSEDVNLVSS